MSSASLYRLSGMILLIGVIVRIVSAIIPFLVSVNIQTESEDLQDPLVAAYYSLTFVSFSLIIIGLPAMYLRQSANSGKLGLTGLLIYIAGTLLDIACIATFTTVMPLLSEKSPELVDAVLDSNFAIFPLGAFLLCFLGAILLGIAVIKAKVFPAYVGALFIASPILYVLSSIIGNDIGGAIFNSLTAIALGIALGKVGLSLASTRRDVSP
ncbi:hypothetical protein [Paenibacillus glycanilyticus]|uniref:DUF4386 family protein n=1 Tax=Paenibacillus glycanilyticus TaxID=126569 RepID=A0ABQ6GM38_9BACL|nr:hypothetical protein [Paenibacillus glycanilyticus]GLX70428.1 hypothetical protein MU1_47740 [Paenibacillus glycanilyticus]